MEKDVGRQNPKTMQTRLGGYIGPKIKQTTSI